MEKTINLQQLSALAGMASEYSNLNDDYLFAHIEGRGDDGGRWDSGAPGPLRIDGMMWVLCLDGEMELDINMERCTLTRGCITVTSPGTIINMHPMVSRDWRCYLLVVSADFMQDINFDLNVLSQMPNRGAFNNPVQRIGDEDMEGIRRYFDLLHLNSEAGRDPAYARPIARCLIAALIYNIIEVVRRSLPAVADEGPKNSRRLTYVRSFMSLVHEHHRHERSVAFYAGRLFISPKYLSLIIKEHTGHSAAQIIDNLVILEAKNLLRYSGKNIQQVAYELNFPNQSSFGKYFKHLTGMSPTEYQRT